MFGINTLSDYPIAMIMNEYVSYDVYFKLSEECRTIKLNGSSDIHFDIQQRNNKNKLVGFTMHIDESNEDKAKLMASQKANVLCSLFTVKYRKFTHPILIGLNKYRADGSQTVQRIFSSGYARIRELDIDLTDNEVEKILTEETLTGLSYHTSIGIRAYFENNPAESIRSFYQVIENSPVPIPKHLKKYKSLRNALSHFGPLCHIQY